MLYIYIYRKRNPLKYTSKIYAAVPCFRHHYFLIIYVINVRR